MEKIKVLLVEDEPVLAGIVKESLEKRGFEIDVAPDGVAGWSMFKQNKPDVCVIDVMMPRKDGFSLVSDIRLADDDTPLIFLTARTQTADVLKGQELGADDYLKKPFSMEELILRLNALVKRRKPVLTPISDTGIVIGRFIFNAKHQQLIYGEEIGMLSQRESDLLSLLLQHKNGLLDRKLALIKLWGDDNPFTARSMDVYITRLRKLLQKDSSIEIVNSRGLGYSLMEYL